MKKIIAILFAITTSLFFTPAQALLVNIDFEGVVGPGGSAPCPTTPYAEDGFTLTAAPPGCNNFISNNASGNNTFGNTTSIMGFCNGCGGTVLTLAGPVFSVLSIDIGSHFGTNPGPLLFTGNISGGGTVTQTIDAGVTWATYALIGFTGLASMDIQFVTDGLGAHASIDNISISVPAPGSLALLGLGLIGLLGFARRKIA